MKTPEQLNTANRWTAFEGSRLLSSGPLVEVALAVKARLESGAIPQFLVFDDQSGRVIDMDLRGSVAEVVERLAEPASPFHDPEIARGRGRPKLGVVGREVTLLPRHWDWLNAQPGGASVALRKLVEQARRTGGEKQQIRLAQETAYRVMVALAGDSPGFEEASRALFANDRARFEGHVSSWPEDVRTYVLKLAFERPAEEPGRN